MKKRIAIILMNTGTPDQPTSQSVRMYLNEFLSDPRIVHLPRWFWLPLLRYIILPIRSPKSAALYQKIWVNDSPLRQNMNDLSKKLETHLNQSYSSSTQYWVRVAMNYGNPKLDLVLKEFEKLDLDQFIFLPLFPQPSFSTTSSSLDQVQKALETFRFHFSKIEWILGYATQPHYIAAIVKRIQSYWELHGKTKLLLISFHGIPTRFVKAGDPYAQFCENTANAVAQTLGLNSDEWQLCYQSQFGYDEWLKPSTQTLFESLPKTGCDSITVCCPGFSVDCLETLEEIQVQGKKDFLKAGGKIFHYVPALNDEYEHIQMITQLCTNHHL